MFIWERQLHTNITDTLCKFTFQQTNKKIEACLQKHQQLGSLISEVFNTSDRYNHYAAVGQCNCAALLLVTRNYLAVC